MDGKSDLLSLIRERISCYDDDALAALANKGLLRRAQKDVEEQSPVILGEADGRLKLEVGDAVVEVGEVPTQSSCSCPAGGVCRHILAALLLLREPGTDAESPVSDTPVSCEPEILAVDEETLRRWAGTPMLRKAVQKVAQGLEVQAEGDAPVVFTIPALNVTCRWMPGGGLAGMVCSCHAPGPCEHRVVAVLAYQVSRGKLDLQEETKLLEASPGAPRTREEVRASVRAVVAEMIAHGVSRVSSEAGQRLQTLAVSAHGVDLPRLERLLKGLADEVTLLQNRDARADTRNLLHSAALAEALCCALGRPTPALVGSHRSRFDPVGTLNLVGMGARRWRTRSGYAGLTVYFWDRSARNWSTWTEARPLSIEAFDGLTRYGQAGPWEGCMHPSQASRSEVQLSSTWRNTVGRLSGRSATRALILSDSDFTCANIIESWSALIDPAVRLFGGGFGERDERDEVVLLKPARWGKPDYDNTRQEMVWVVYDSSGRELNLVLPNSPETADAMQVIEKSSRSNPRAVLGLLRLVSGRIIVEPVSLHGEFGVLNLTLDNSTPAPVPAWKKLFSGEDDIEPIEEDNLPDSPATPIGLLLVAVEAELELVAEAGVSVMRDTSTLGEFASRMNSLGLASCSKLVTGVIDALRDVSRGQTEPHLAAQKLLRAYYICRVASAQETVLAMMER